jgi:putative flippase GtrA
MTGDDMATITKGVRFTSDARWLVILYTLFAVFAGLCNLVSQEVTLRLWPAFPLMGAVLAGTGVGFVVKYILDKHWIFADAYEGHALELRKIILYGLFSVGTTAIFWGIEIGAWHLWETSAAKYVGAVFGLVLGNWIKFRLDRAWVFPRASR